MGHGVSIVTGGCGFLGRAIVRRLLLEGRNVLVLDDWSSPGSREAWPVPDNFLDVIGNDGGHAARAIDYGIDSPARLFVRRLNLASPTFNRSRLLDSFAFVPEVYENGVAEIWHFASPASPELYKARRLDTLRLGTRALDVLLELAAHRPGSTSLRLLYASSSEVYGDPEQSPQHESYRGNVSTIGPRSCYDEAKRAGEAFCAAAREELGVDARIARIFNSYGPGMRPEDGRLVPKLLAAIARGETFEVRGGGMQTRSFSYVDDTVAGLFAIMRSDYEAGPVNVGGDEELSVRDLLGRCVELFDIAPGFRVVDAPAEDQHDPRRRRPELHRLRALGWAPTVALEDGLRRTMDWIRSLPSSES